MEATEDGELLRLEDLLPSLDAGREAAYARTVLSEELDAALDDLPDEHAKYSSMSYSRQEPAAQTGVRVNTLLSRMHYAILHLRERLQAIYDEFTKA